MLEYQPLTVKTAQSEPCKHELPGRPGSTFGLVQTRDDWEWLWCPNCGTTYHYRHVVKTAHEDCP